jgi:OmpA-OmpF porin, OOP family
MKRSLIIGALLMVAACAQQPPPPPVVANPPPPPPPPPPTYSVYFDYNSSLLGPSGREIVRLAAGSYKAGSPGTIQVIGYTDPSGSGPYNQKLSLKRASVVAATLVQDGVPRSALTVSGQGESTTGADPGRDRRVEIVLGRPPPAS